MTRLPGWLKVIPLPMPATLGVVNTYLIRGPDGIGLIDTGMDDVNSVQELEKTLGDMGLGIADINSVVCTHHHPDHCGIGATLQTGGARVLMSRDDAKSLDLFLEHPDVDMHRSTFYGRHKIPGEFGDRVTAMFPFFRSLQQAFVPDTIVADGDQVDLGGISFEILDTPGHTKGHICLYQRDEGIIFTGDHVIPQDATHVSMREEVHGTDPLGRFIDSLERVGRLGAITGLGGHGEPMPDVSERTDQLVRHHKARIEQVAGVLTDEPRTAYDLALEAMGPRNKVFARWLAMSQTLAYLEHLAAKGRALEVQLSDTVAFKLT